MMNVENVLTTMPEHDLDSNFALVFWRTVPVIVPELAETLQRPAEEVVDVVPELEMGAEEATRRARLFGERLRPGVDVDLGDGA